MDAVERMALYFKHPQDLTKLRIVGQQVELVTIGMSYAEDIFKEFTEKVTTYMVPTAPKVLGETEAFIQHSIDEMRAGTDVVCVIRDVHSGEFLGCCGLHGQRNPQGPEFGIWLKESAQQHGYGKDAIRALGAWAARHIDLSVFIYPADKANLCSCKVAESFGGKVQEERLTRRMNGDWLNTQFYLIPKSSFEVN